MFERLINNLYLRLYHRKKRNTPFVSDFLVKEWFAGLNPDDIGHYRMELPISIGVVIGIRVVNVDKMGEFLCDNVRLDIEYIKGCKPIRECNFNEFKELYSDLIIYIRSQGGIVDMVRETKNYYYKKANMNTI